MKTFQPRLLLVLSLATLFLGACIPSTTYTLWKNYPHLWPVPTRHSFIVLMCKFSDVPDVPAGLDDHIGQFLTYQGQGLGNMLDYYGDVSYGAISLSATRVAGWYNAPYAVQAQQYPPPNQDDFERQYGSSARYQRILQCTNAVPPADVDFSKYYGVVVVLNAVRDGGAWGTGQQDMVIHGQHHPLGMVLFDPYSFYTQFAAHEIGHALGMPHSYDNTQIVCSQGAKPGEYCDPWDIMGGGYTFAGSNFPDPYGDATYDGPGLNAPNLLQLGWIPPTRIATYHIDDPATTFVLKALSHPIGFEPLSVEIVGSDPNDLFTVEYRQQAGWDAGIPENTVLIHEYKPGASPYSYLQRNTSRNAGEWLPGMSWTNPPGVSVTVKSIDATAGTATITIGRPSLVSNTPIVKIQVPANGSHVTAGVPFLLVATAMTGGGTPLPDAAVAWQANGNTLGMGHTLTTTLSPAGTDTITVRGTDPSNGLSATDSITLYVDPPAPPPAKPTVQILSPTNGASYPVNGFSGSLTLYLSSQASTGVTTYLWSDSLNLFTDTHANDTLTLTPTVSQIPCNTPFSDVITLTVTDSHGQTASASVTITIERVCLT